MRRLIVIGGALLLAGCFDFESLKQRPNAQVDLAPSPRDMASLPDQTTTPPDQTTTPPDQTTTPPDQTTTPPDQTTTGDS